jgi:hypothetical protein
MLHIGNSKTIANVETEVSKEAAACRIFYDDVLEEILKARHWPFAKKFATLALVEEDPTVEWKYAYRYPSDCLEVRRIIDDSVSSSNLDELGGDRSTPERTGDYHEPYVIGQDDSGLLIYTNKDTAQIEYTIRVESIVRWPSDFKMALSFLLGFYVAPVLTGGDPFKMGARCFEMYKMKLEDAGANAGNEEQQKANPDSEFIRTRWGY